ncbi:MAG: NTP transferase domain-containing protein [Spirochaetales bacterium]|uniref:NTP transferase domain-containing protein n=1 Tax=Candidatus Thalassospirochaeta sargassi TaxID=3119039 RepID=A0AAJ1ICP1_9SPIO|nr:NTP transferase domain-containing protein [Spirochaetales bacterium]
MKHPSITAVIAAAGYSSRMSAHKALYPIGDELVIERAVRILSDGGVDRVYAVTGYKRQLLHPVLRRMQSDYPLAIIENPDYKRGMFSSVLAGVRALPDETEGFLMLPVDYPFVEPRTVAMLIESADHSDADIISPVYNGNPGHPPFIKYTVFNAILEADENAPDFRGLHSVLSSPAFRTESVEVDDCGILDDIDDDSEYRSMIKKHCRLDVCYPGPFEIDRIIRKKRPSGQTVRHMEKTAELAVRYAERLNSCGHRLNPGLLKAAALLHDICKPEPDHARAGGRLLSEFGYPETGEIIAQHMDIIHNEDDEIDEAAVLYFVDKLFEEEKLMTLDKRLELKLEPYSENSETGKNIRERFKKAGLIQRKINRICTGL